MIEAVIEGAHWVVPPADGARIAIGYQGPVAPEAMAAFAELAAEEPGAGLLAITSPDRLHAGWIAALRARRNGERTARCRMSSVCWRRWRRRAALVTVLDGHPATHAWLGAVRGQRVVPLGPDHFGQSGDIPDLYREYGIDQDAILDACAQALLAIARQMMRFCSGSRPCWSLSRRRRGARADDVTDQINEALKAYQNHDTQTAIAALDAAANLLRQARAEGLKKLLPPPPPGWTADAAEATAVGVGDARWRHHREPHLSQRRQQVEVQIIADSPMLQGMAALIGSPFAAVGGTEDSRDRWPPHVLHRERPQLHDAGRRQGDREDRRQQGYAGSDSEELHRRDRLRRRSRSWSDKSRSVIVSSYSRTIDLRAAEHMVLRASESGESVACGFGLIRGDGLLAATSALAQPASNDPLAQIGHIVVIFEENRSFDNFFGKFPGANGLANAGDKAIQIDADGKPYKFLPARDRQQPEAAGVDKRFPAQLPNRRSRSTPMSRSTTTPAI